MVADIRIFGGLKVLVYLGGGRDQMDARFKASILSLKLQKNFIM